MWMISKGSAFEDLERGLRSLIWLGFQLLIMKSHCALSKILTMCISGLIVIRALVRPVIQAFYHPKIIPGLVDAVSDDKM